MLTSLRPFTRHLRGRKKALAGLFVLGLVGSAAGLASPLIGKTFIDAVATRHEYGAIPGIAAALVALAIADLLVSVVSRLAMPGSQPTCSWRSGSGCSNAASTPPSVSWSPFATATCWQGSGRTCRGYRAC